MNWVDIVLSVFILLGALNGYRKGFVDQISGLIAIFLAIFASFKFSGLIREFLLEKEIVSEGFVGIASLILTFLLVFFGIKWSAQMVEKVIKSVGLNFINRIGGAVVGLVIQLLILTAIVYFMYPFLEKLDIKAIESSEVLPPIRQLGKDLAQMLL